MNFELRRFISQRKENDMDDLIIHKIAKANIDAMKELKMTISILEELEPGQEKVTILSVLHALNKIKKKLEVDNNGTNDN